MTITHITPREMELMARVAELEKDAARLDYLDGLATYQGRSFMGGTHHLEFTHDLENPNSSFRAAIDDAMRKALPT